MLSNQWKSLHLGLWELVFKVMDEGSITRVADMNSIQRSRLSRLISSLEEETGHRLLERQGRKLEPTMAALELRAKIEPMISDIRKTLEAEKENADSDKGGIRFGAMPGFLQTQVVPLIAEFQKRHPQVSVRNGRPRIQYFDALLPDECKQIRHQFCNALCRRAGVCYLLCAGIFAFSV